MILDTNDKVYSTDNIPTSITHYASDEDLGIEVYLQCPEICAGDEVEALLSLRI